MICLWVPTASHVGHLIRNADFIIALDSTCNIARMETRDQIKEKGDILSLINSVDTEDTSKESIESPYASEPANSKPPSVKNGVDEEVQRLGDGTVLQILLFYCRHRNYSYLCCFGFGAGNHAQVSWYVQISFFCFPIHFLH